jgi:hypothetical protein
MVKKNAGKSKDKTKKRGSKKEKKEGPKKPLSGFMFFSQERRKTLKEEKPDLKITEASVIIGAEWKKLDDSDKEPYLKMAKEDKDRYDQEKEKFDAAAAKKKSEVDSEEEEKEDHDDSEDDDDE